MPGSKDGSTRFPRRPNAFNPTFLQQFDQRDEPPAATEADVAGPWAIEPIPDQGFGLFRAGESLARGFEPTAVFHERWMALLAAAVLPGTGRDPLLHLSKEAGPDGYAVTLDGGEVVGRLALFDERLLDAMNTVAGMVRSPQALTDLLEAAGPAAVERCGAILEERVTEGEAKSR